MERCSGKERKRIKIMDPVYGNVLMTFIRHQKMVADSKTRWKRKREEHYNIEGEDVTEEETEMKTEELMYEEEKDSQVYSKERHEMDFSKLRPTCVKNNQRVILP